MTDSDSDDDILLSGPSFQRTRQSRTEENRKRNHHALLDDAIIESDRQIDTMTKIAQLMRENLSCCDIDDDELRATTVALLDTNKSSATAMRFETDDGDFVDEYGPGTVGPGTVWSVSISIR